MEEDRERERERERERKFCLTSNYLEPTLAAALMYSPDITCKDS
jgi:hypothetical protein